MRATKSGVMLIAVVIAMYLFFSLPIYTLSKIGLMLFVLFSAKLFDGMGKEVEMRDILIVIGLLQWVAAPILSYHFWSDDPIFFMAVTEEVYMDYVVPAMGAFIAGLYLPFWKRSFSDTMVIEQIKAVMQRYPFIDLLLIAFGSIILFTYSLVPGFLQFFVFLLSGTRFIGLYFLFLSKRPYKWVLIVLVMLWLFSSSLSDGFFHRLILWLGFLLLVMAVRYKFNIAIKFGLIVGLLFFTFIIHIIKNEIRNAETADRDLGMFTEMFAEKIDDPYLFSEVYLKQYTVRLNQGWIISMIMNHTPRIEPFADGETVRNAIMASIFPRAIFGEKATSGTGENFEKYTGHGLSGGTSMGLSVIGEAYANYGVNGGILFMFILGFFYNFYLFMLFKYIRRHPILFFFIPLMFLLVVKAETDLASTLNYLIKASISVAILFLVARRALRINV